MKAPNHTFVILAYRESPYLERCIESLLRQTLASTVLISTSTPNEHITRLAEKYQLHVVTNPNGGSIGKDWNFGFQSAETEYVTLAHQDDEYLPEFAERCVGAAERHSSAKPLIAFTRSAVRRGDAECTPSYKNLLRLLLIFPFHFRRCIGSRFWKRFILLFSNAISCPGVFYVKRNLPQFTFKTDAFYTLDWEAWFELSRREGAFIYVPRILHVHREHPDSATSTTKIETLQHEELELLSKMWGNPIIPRILIRLLRLAK